MSFEFLDSCGVAGVISVFVGSLFVFGSMILTYSFRQIGIKKYLIFHGIFVVISLGISGTIYQMVERPDAAVTCATAPLKMLLWIPAVIILFSGVHFFMKKKVKAQN